MQVMLLLLLFGNTCGCVAVLSDVGHLIVERVQPANRLDDNSTSPASGMAIQLLVVFGLVFPLCMLQDIRSVSCPPLPLNHHYLVFPVHHHP